MWLIALNLTIIPIETVNLEQSMFSMKMILMTIGTALFVCSDVAGLAVFLVFHKGVTCLMK